MPRAARLVLPGLPHHVTQRGNRRQPTFFGDEDYALYLALLRHGCRKSGTAVWAWCMMPNHVHLVLVPSYADGLRAALAPAHTRYTMDINRREGWRGHLWQSRFASFPMDEAHVHACLRYVELNPVRARLAERPEDWRWSSARAHLGLAADGLTDLAAASAGIDDWRAFLGAGLADEDREAIRTAERTGRMGTVTSDCPTPLPERGQSLVTVPPPCPRAEHLNDATLEAIRSAEPPKIVPPPQPPDGRGLMEGTVTSDCPK